MPIRLEKLKTPVLEGLSGTGFEKLKIPTLHGVSLTFALSRIWLQVSQTAYARRYAQGIENKSTNPHVPVTAYRGLHNAHVFMRFYFFRHKNHILFVGLLHLVLWLAGVRKIRLTTPFLYVQ